MFFFIPEKNLPDKSFVENKKKKEKRTPTQITPIQSLGNNSGNTN